MHVSINEAEFAFTLCTVYCTCIHTYTNDILICLYLPSNHRVYMQSTCTSYRIGVGDHGVGSWPNKSDMTLIIGVHSMLHLMHYYNVCTHWRSTIAHGTVSASSWLLRLVSHSHSKSHDQVSSQHWYSHSQKPQIFMTSSTCAHHVGSLKNWFDRFFDDLFGQVSIFRKSKLVTPPLSHKASLLIETSTCTYIAQGDSMEVFTQLLFSIGLCPN